MASTPDVTSGVTRLTFDPSDKTVDVALRNMLNNLHRWVRDTDLTKVQLEGLRTCLDAFGLNTTDAQEKLLIISQQTHAIDGELPSGEQKSAIVDALDQLSQLDLAQRPYDFCRSARALLNQALTDLSSPAAQDNKHRIWGTVMPLLKMLQEEHMPESMVTAANAFDTLLTQYTFETAEVSWEALQSAHKGAHDAVAENYGNKAARLFGDLWYWRS